MPKSTRKPRLEKPRPDFPLFPHQGTNRWAKKIRGKLHYFGRVLPDDPHGEQALQRWLDQKDDLLAGRVPRAKADTLSVGDIVNLWLDAKKARVATEELTPRTWDDYRKIGVLLVETLGRSVPVAQLGPRDFRKLREVMAGRWGPTRLGNAIQMVRGLFNWAKAEGLIEIPLYGAQFAKPAAKAVRAVRSAKGPRMMQPTEVHKLLATASPNMTACILLAANAGVGPSDLARLPISVIDLSSGWVDYPRHKTGVARRFPLWPETVKAIRHVLAHRPEPAPGCEDVLFLRPKGRAYIGKRGEILSDVFREEFPKAKHTLYDLRRGFQTVGEKTKDLIAVAAIMGHSPKPGDMAATYRQTIDDGRLRAVVTVVHGWLFGQDDKPDGEPGDDDRQHGQEARQLAVESTRIQRAVMKCLAAIAAAEGPNRTVLASVWNSSEIALALSGDTWTVEKFLRTWGDDPPPALRIVG